MSGDVDHARPRLRVSPLAGAFQDELEGKETPRAQCCLLEGERGDAWRGECCDRWWCPISLLMQKDGSWRGEGLKWYVQHSCRAFTPTRTECPAFRVTSRLEAYDSDQVDVEAKGAIAPSTMGQEKTVAHANSCRLMTADLWTIEGLEV